MKPKFANLKGMRDAGVHNRDLAEAVRARTSETDADKAKWARFITNEETTFNDKFPP
jgi:hypothetical protein